MMPSDDDRLDMDDYRGTASLSERDVDALLAGRDVLGWDDLHHTLQVLRSATPPPAPTPSAALQAVLGAGFDPLPLADAARPAAPWRRWCARTAVATAAVLATTLGAAAANALPAPLQNAVVTAVGALTPLELPRPVGERPVVESGVGSKAGTAPGSDAPPTGVPAREGDPPHGLPSEDSAAGTPEQGGQPSVTSPTQPAATTLTPTTRGQRDDDADDGDGREGADADVPDAGGSDGVREADDVEPDRDEPDTDQPDRDEVDTDQPDRDEVDTDQPDLDAPDTDQPDIDEPDVDEPDTDDGPAHDADRDDDREDDDREDDSGDDD